MVKKVALMSLKPSKRFTSAKYIKNKRLKGSGIEAVRKIKSGRLSDKFELRTSHGDTFKVKVQKAKIRPFVKGRATSKNLKQFVKDLKK